MNTDELIDKLSANIEPVRRRTLALSFGVAVIAAAAAAFGATLLALGPRSDFHMSGVLEYLLLKLGFTLGIVSIASWLLTKLSRPGGEWRMRSALALLPFAAIVVLAGFNLADAPTSQWETMIVGDTWLKCLVAIPVLAIVPFAVIVSAVRRFAAPTDLTVTGAFAGLVAGGVSATGYALHCTDDSLAFVALWYGGTIALCALAGALLGPRLLRW